MNTDELRRLPELPALPRPVHFVCKDLGRWPEVVAGEMGPDELHRQPDRVVFHEDIGVVQTYVNLAACGLDVSLVADAVPGEVNVVSSIDFRVKDRTAQCFVVAHRGDWARPELADVVVTMNRGIARRRHDHYLPHWIQTGLIPRDTTRGTRVERVVFSGDLVNLDPRFAEPSFAERVARLGMEFVARPYDRSTASSGWHDCSEVDVMLAIRAIHPTELSTKPASKLVNAWAAGTPALLGAEPAFEELRRSPLDYVSVSGPDDAITALERLRDEPDRYRNMVEHGTQRAREFTDEVIAWKWFELLAGPVEEQYGRWRSRPRRLRDVMFATRVVRHEAAMKAFKLQQSTR
ncbi:MAG: glycosyltransferase [Microthrixaceae bacterium]